MRKPIGLTAPYREDDDDIQEYKKPWVGLTDKERSELWEQNRASSTPHADYAKAIEAKLKEKNT